MKRSAWLLFFCIVVLVVGAVGPLEWFLQNYAAPHWADREIALLEEQGVPFPWRKKEWDAPVTNAECCALIAAVFSSEPREEELFSDVGRDHPFFAAINSSASEVFGKSRLFEPDHTVTRKDLLLICRRLGVLSPDAESRHPVTDVAPDLAPLVSAALELRLFTAERDRFCPDDPVTRAALGAVLSRILKADLHPDARIRRRAVEYLRRFETGSAAAELCTGRERERQQFRESEVLPFADGATERTLNDLTVTLHRDRIDASADLVQNDRTVRALWSLTAEDRDGQIFFSDSAFRFVTAEPIRMVWEYSSDPGMEYTHKNAANIVSPVWFRIGEEQTADDFYSAAFREEAKRRGQAVWATFTNGFSPDLTRFVLSDEAKRRELIRTVISKADQYGLDGLNLDFENMYPEDRDLYARFCEECAAYAKEYGLFLSADITKIEPTSDFYSMCYNRAAMAQSLDYLMLMAYDQHPSGSAVAGPVAALDWTEQAIVGVLGSVPADRLVLGVPFYSRIWQTEGGVVTDASAVTMEQSEAFLREHSLTAVWDDNEKLHYAEYADGETLYRLWQEDCDSLSARLDLIDRYRLCGIACWSGGCETEECWKLIKQRLEK